MRYTEFAVLGVYFAPITWMMAISCTITVLLRFASRGIGVSQRVWHPALFWLATYVTLLSSIVLFISR